MARRRSNNGYDPNVDNWMVTWVIVGFMVLAAGAFALYAYGPFSYDRVADVPAMERSSTTPSPAPARTPPATTGQNTPAR